MRTAKNGRALVRFCDASTLYMNRTTHVSTPVGDLTEVKSGEARQLVPSGKEHEVRTPVGDAFGTDIDVRVRSDSRSVFVSVNGIAQVENSKGSVVLHPNQETTIQKGHAPSKPSHVDATALVTWTHTLITTTPTPTPTSPATPVPSRDSSIVQFSTDVTITSDSGQVTSSQVFPDPVFTAQCFIQVSVNGLEPNKYGNCGSYAVEATCGSTAFDATGKAPDHGSVLTINGTTSWHGLRSRSASCATVPGVNATLSAQVTGLSPGQSLVIFWNNDARSSRSGCVSYMDVRGFATSQCITNAQSGKNGTYYETTADASTGTIYETAGHLKGNVTLGGVFILPLPATASPTPTDTPTVTPIPTSTSVPTLAATPTPTPTGIIVPVKTYTPKPTTSPVPTKTATPTPPPPTATPTPAGKPTPTPTPTFIIP
ncbi:MAG TPA: hypothetical protein VF898_05460 [Chloroflexota bacterium]